MLTFDVQAPPGGIMTRRAGAVTGPVTIGIHPDRKVIVAYRGSDEWYRVVGSAADLTDDQIVAQLTRDPGRERGGNPIPAQLGAPTHGHR